MSFSLLIFLSGCLGLNDVSPISPGSASRLTPKAGRAIVFYGIGVEGKWKASSAKDQAGATEAM
jgi:hypothetical protein